MKRTENPTSDVIVVGAGISGLTTATLLQEAGLRVTVLEASDRPGGSIRTLTSGDWRFELGPSTLLERDAEVRRLVGIAGLGAERIEAAPAAKRRYLWRRGRLVRVPTGPVELLTTRLFTPGAILRLLAEPWIAAAPPDREESVAEFVRRRLGREVLERAVEPFVSGIYAGDAERLAMRWAFPVLVRVEREHGSLIRGMLARRRGPAPRAARITFRGGLQRLADGLASRLADLRTQVTCDGVTRQGELLVATTSEGALAARHVVLSVPARSAARLLAEASDGASLRLAEVPYAPVAVVGLGFPLERVGNPVDGFGFLVSPEEDLGILGCLVPSAVFPDRAPDGHVALTTYLGGRHDPEIVAAPDEEILKRVLRDLRRVLAIEGDPVFRTVWRWPAAIPQYELGHGSVVELAARLERELPGVHLRASYLGGPSLHDCIRESSRLASRIVESKESSPSRPPSTPVAEGGVAPVRVGAEPIRTR